MSIEMWPGRRAGCCSSVSKREVVKWNLIHATSSRWRLWKRILTCEETSLYCYWCDASEEWCERCKAVWVSNRMQGKKDVLRSWWLGRGNVGFSIVPSHDVAQPRLAVGWLSEVTRAMQHLLYEKSRLYMGESQIMHYHLLKECQSPVYTPYRSVEWPIAPLSTNFSSQPQTPSPCHLIVQWEVYPNSSDALCTPYSCHAALGAFVFQQSLLVELTVDESVEHVETGSWLVVRNHVATLGH